MTTPRISVRKTLKLFIGGQFPRSESGRYLPVVGANGTLMSNISYASKKDLRDAVVVARKAQDAWAARTAFNRGQIVYRIAEVLEARRAQLEKLLIDALGLEASAAAAEVSEAVDRLVWYAGWADKFEQFLGSVNPVAAPFHNVSRVEAVGVVAVFAPNSPALLGLISAIAPVIVAGNTCIVSTEGAATLLAVELAEILATSDVPGGVVNLLTGKHADLQPTAASHMDIDAIALFDVADDQARAIGVAASETIKRVRRRDAPAPGWWFTEAAQSPWWIADFVEIKTAWHPVAT